jgi:hypothetical protein
MHFFDNVRYLARLEQSYIVPKDLTTSRTIKWASVHSKNSQLKLATSRYKRHFVVKHVYLWLRTSSADAASDYFFGMSFDTKLASFGTSAVAYQSCRETLKAKFIDWLKPRCDTGQG